MGIEIIHVQILSFQNSHKWCSKHFGIQNMQIHCIFNQQRCKAHNNFEWWTKSILRLDALFWIIIWAWDFVSLKITLSFHFPFFQTIILLSLVISSEQLILFCFYTWLLHRLIVMKQGRSLGKWCCQTAIVYFLLTFYHCLSYNLSKNKMYDSFI